MDEAGRAQLLNAVLQESAKPAHGCLGPWLDRMSTVREEEAQAVAAMPWSTFSDRKLASVKNHYADMLVAIQRMFGSAGEELLRNLGVLPKQPATAGNLVRALYVRSIVLTRQPDPLPFLRLVYSVAAAGPAAENELVRRLRAAHGGEVPRIVATGKALSATPEERAWVQRVVPGVAFATLEAEREDALLDLASKVMASLRKRRSGVWGVLRADAVPEEGTTRWRPGDRPNRRPDRRAVDEVLEHAIQCHTLTGTHAEWGRKGVDSLVRAALKGTLAYAQLRLASRYLDHWRQGRRWNKKALLFGLDPHAGATDDVKIEVREEIEAASLASAAEARGQSQHEHAKLEAKLEVEAWRRFLTAHPEHSADAKLFESGNKSVVGLARERRVDPTTIRRRREHVQAAYRAHVTGADGCGQTPA